MGIFERKVFSHPDQAKKKENPAPITIQVSPSHVLGAPSRDLTQSLLDIKARIIDRHGDGNAQTITWQLPKDAKKHVFTHPDEVEKGTYAITHPDLPGALNIHTSSIKSGIVETEIFETHWIV